MSSPARAPTAPPTLVRVIGTWGLAAAIVNITVGGGIFRLPATAAGSLGAAAPAAYLVCAFAMGLVVWCMASAARSVPLTGGPYAYVGAAFGPYAGFLSGVLLWVVGTFACAAVSTVFAANVTALVPASGGRLGSLLVLALTLGLWTLVNLRGVTLGARMNSMATIAKLAPLALVAIGGAAFIDVDHLRIVEVPATADVARASLILIFAFCGIEVALVPSGEVRDTSRTVPRAIALAMTGVTVLYIALQVVAQGILGPALATGTATPLADAAGASLGPWARPVLLAGAAISMFGYLGGMTLSMPRMLFALARDGFLPRALGRLDERHRSPRLAIVAQSALTLALAASGTFEQLAVFANIGGLTLYLGCALAAWRLRQVSPDPDTSPARSAAGRVVPWLTCAVIAWLLSGLTTTEWIGLFGLLAGASVLYVAALAPARA